MTKTTTKTTKRKTPTPKPAPAEGTDASPEYEAGYNAFMRRCAGYALAHAGESWEPYWAAGKDDRPETPDYVEGWQDAKSRMFREVQLDFGAGNNPRAATAVNKLMQSGAAPHGVGISFDDQGLTIATPLAA